MFKQFFLATLTIALFVCSSCSSNDTKKDGGIDYDAAAKDLCACMQPLMDINQQIMDVAASGDTEKARELYSKISEIATSQEKCVLDLEEKYGDLNGAEQEAKAKEAMKKHCPDVIGLMEEYEG